MTIREKFKHWLSEPVDGHVIGLFRLVLGIFMVYNTISYYRRGLIENGLLAPKILFKYDGFGWVQPLPLPAMYAVMVLMGLAAALVATGLLFRWGCWVFALSLAFILFQDKSYFNNHIYLFVLLPVLMSFTDADRFLSLRSRNRPFNAVPRWQQFILQAQVVIVYFYGGLTKLKMDWWFRKEPVTSMVNAFPVQHWLAPLFKTGFMINTLTYGGLLLDLLSPLLLWYKPVRRLALIPFLVFHLSNSRIFDDIGIFPYVMLVALVLYFETQEIPGLRNLAAYVPGASARKKQKQQVVLPDTPLWATRVLIGYFVFQLLFPFRGYFLPNPMDWTGIGRNFSWRMKVHTRPIEEMAFTLTNPVDGKVFPVDIRSFINEMQVANLARDAGSVAAFARMLRAEAAQHGLPNAIVKARIRVRYNMRPPQFFVNPDVDLASVTYSPFRKLDWVMPLEE